MPKITHIPRKAFEQGVCSEYPVAIRIADDLSQLQAITNSGQTTYTFVFLDTEDESGITEEDARKIMDALLNAKYNDDDVVIHCEAGISRSGAVAQFAIDCLGFDDYPAPVTAEGQPWRVPNKRVFEFLMKIRSDILGTI